MPGRGPSRRCTRRPRHAGRAAATVSSRSGIPSPASTTAASSTSNCRGCWARAPTRRRTSRSPCWTSTHFKRINDTFSHDVGDQVLCTFAELVQEAGTSVGAGSFAARVGGEEFLLVLVGAAPAEAARHLEDVRRAVRDHPWAELTRDLPVTVSIGTASSVGRTDEISADVLGRADAHLYVAKRNGRDQVVTDVGDDLDDHRPAGSLPRPRP